MPQTKPRIATEAIAGLTTFLTMAYIVVVNPAILATEGTGMPFNGVLTATVILAASMTLLMGLYAKLPFAVAPGMGINAFFAFTLVLGQQIPWPVALGMVFWAGIFFLIISVTPLREQIARAIPQQLRIAAATGIGIFLTFIGLKNMGLVVADPATFVKLGHIGAPQVLALIGMLFMIWLAQKKNPMAFLGGMAFITAMSFALGLSKAPEQLFSTPDFGSVFFKLDPLGALRWAYLPAILSILFTDLFDSLSTFVGVAHATGLTDKNGHPKNLRQGLIVDSVATFAAGLFGTSSGTAFIESAAGIEMGGRSGLTSVFTALLFLPCLFIAPIAAAIPGYATAPVLVLVGAFMFRSISGLKLEKLEDVIPAFLTVTLIPLTFSITQGILWGFVSHVALYAMAGRRRELHPMMIGLAVISLLLLWIEKGRSVILETRKLTKRYKDLTAVYELDLKIREGLCFGLLGPNGAGKTTTLEMIEGILPPTSGEILYRGKPAGMEFRENMGIQFQSTALPDRLHVGEVLELFSAFYKKHANIEELKQLCDLSEFWNRDASELSGGQRQRLLLALALVNDPELVFLDEPTTGLDPAARRKFWELVRLIRKRGKTVVLTTHYMEEAYELCDVIAIMDHGRIIAQGSPDELLREHFRGLSIRIPKGEWDPHGIANTEVFDRTDAFELLTETPDDTMRALLDRHVPLQGIQIRTRNLEDLFLKLTGKGFET